MRNRSLFVPAPIHSCVLPLGSSAHIWLWISQTSGCPPVTPLDDILRIVLWFLPASLQEEPSLAGQAAEDWVDPWTLNKPMLVWVWAFFLLDFKNCFFDKCHRVHRPQKRYGSKDAFFQRWKIVIEVRFSVLTKASLFKNISSCHKL